MISFLQVENLSKRFGEQLLFENITFGIGKNQKVALIAKNGMGKSTLLRIIAGKDSADTGSVIFRNDISIGILDQDPELNPENYVFEEVFNSENPTLKLIKTYEQAVKDNDASALEELIPQMDALAAWDYDTQVKQILSELKVDKYSQRIKELSGGQRKRAGLAKILISNPDFLILDEPTNHLDVEMTEWLEEYLEKTNATLLMVTHDRYFLDRVCDKIIEIDDFGLFAYEGNYSYYLEKRDERIEARNASIDKAKNLLRTEQEWMRRMPQARGHKAKYRIDNFYKIKEVASQNTTEQQLELDIKGQRLGKKILELEHVNKSYGDFCVLRDFSYKFVRGEKIGIIGKNGVGKSTFLNIITRQHNQPGRRTQARIMYGSYNTQKYMINNGYNIGNFSSYISLNHDRTDGHRPDSKFHITNGFAKLGYKIDDHYKVTGDVSLAKFKNQNPGEITNPLIDNIMNILRGTTSFALENNYGKTSGALRAFYNWGHHKIDDGYNPGGTPNPYLFYSDDHNAGFLLYQSFRLVKGNSFTVGIDYKNWGGNAWQDSINGNQNELVNKTVNEVAGYVIMQQDLFDKVSLNAGVRYEHNSIFGGEWIPQAGFTVRPFEGNVIKASLSKGFRSPNIREMYMFPPQNPDLKPERMMNYEVSIGQTFLDGNLFTELTAFFIDGQDMIETTRIDGRPKNVNTGTFTNKGIEFDSRYQILKNLSLDMNYSYLHTSKALLAAPAHKFFAGVMYAPGRFTFNVNVQSIFDLYINTADKVKEDYTVLNAKVAYRFGTRDKGLNLFVKGENLTAARYSINEGFPMPKAIFMGGIDVTF